MHARRQRRTVRGTEPRRAEAHVELRAEHSGTELRLIETKGSRLRGSFEPETVIVSLGGGRYSQPSLASKVESAEPWEAEPAVTVV